MAGKGSKKAEDDQVSPTEKAVSDYIAGEHMELGQELGLAGRMAQAFIHSPITPLLFFAMLAMGIMGLILTPRQEDPQISVPMIDIYVQYPGASSSEVSSLAIEPLERIMSEIPGVKHVYSAAERGQGIVTVRFLVGEELGPSIVKVHDKIQSNLDKMPPGVMPPLVKPVGIDDVPAVTLTLWSENLDQGQLRSLANDVLQRLKEIPNTGPGFVVGGLKEQIRVQVRPERLSGFNVSLDQVAHTIRTANSEQRAGSTESSGMHFTVYTGSYLRNASDVANLMIATRNDAPVYVRDVADVSEKPEEPKSLVTYYSGMEDEDAAAHGMPAVTIAIAKKVGSNGVTVAHDILEKIESLRSPEVGLITPDMHVEVTRNYGETARNKVNALILKLFIATGAVTLLVWFFLGWRPAFVVTLVIPVVLLMTVFAAWLGGFTIDRVSLFALIFSIGILVDDAIVVIENIYRRWLAKGVTDTATAIDAVREVGNPTILATFTVVAALMPMAFVSGLMGPYMSPIPALGSVAMMLSLFAAFVFVPWLAMRIKPGMQALEEAEHAEEKDNARVAAILDRSLVPLIEDKRKGHIFLVMLLVVFFVFCMFFLLKWVPVKMLPYDNKPEFSVVINMPSGTAVPTTANLTNRIAERLREDVPHVTALQTYVGTAKPFDFNGMVRHYYLRDKPWQAEIQVQLKDKGLRSESSHELAVMARGLVNEIATEYNEQNPNESGKGVKTTVVEMPPGPPVLQTVVAEIYGPDAETRRDTARQLTRIFENTEGMADVDNYLQDDYQIWRFEVDAEKAVRRGISVDTINRNLSMALGGTRLGDIKRGKQLEPTYIVLEIPLSERSDISRLGDLPVPMPGGQGTIPLAELGTFIRAEQDPIIYHKDLRPVEYVVGDAVGRLGAPIYPMLKINDALSLDENQTVDGVNMVGTFTSAPVDRGHSAFEWGGEWTVTYETFRDMGLAFAVALIVIYILVVWEFGNFIVPAVIMAPIPLTMLGVIPGHALLGAEFTATSMIGFIALAGIIVRNSILLVDFAIHEVKEGKTNAEAVVEACRARTRPIVITALALVAGSFVILTDPIFQGMAISLLFGVLVSSVLTLVVIPLGCISVGPYLCPDCDLLPSKGGGDEPSGSGGGWMETAWARVSSAGVMVFFMMRALAIVAYMAMLKAAKQGRKAYGQGHEKIRHQARRVQSRAEQRIAEKRAQQKIIAERKQAEKQQAEAKMLEQEAQQQAQVEQKRAAETVEKQIPEPVVVETTRAEEEPVAKVRKKTRKKARKKAKAATSAKTAQVKKAAKETSVETQPMPSENEEKDDASAVTSSIERPMPVVKKRVARKKKIKAESIPATRKRPSVRAKTVTPPSLADAPLTKTNGNGNGNGKSVHDQADSSTEASITKVPTRPKGARRGIRLNPNI